MPPRTRRSSPPGSKPSGGLTPDTGLSFPEFVLLKASAGSGKTHALSLRFVQFLLSERVGQLTRSDLTNILAITFTRNAAREMKERILDWLKRCASGEKAKVVEIQKVVQNSADGLMRAAEEAVDRILSHYSDFQVNTIDSFTSAVFKASAVDLGISPDFQIVLEPAEIIGYAFSRFIRKIGAGTPEGRDFERILDLFLMNQAADSAFDWDPAAKVLKKIDALYRKLSATNKPLNIEDLSRDKTALENAIGEASRKLEEAVEGSKFAKNMRSSFHTKILPDIESGDYADLIKASFKTPPVLKSSPSARPAKGTKTSGAGDEVLAKIMGLWARLEAEVKRYRRVFARSFYHPYLLGYRSFKGTLDLVKRQQGVVFIDDINQQLAGYIDQGIVPDIYLRLGERIYHFLIDEFQDTSPMQWLNLVPLIENSLAQAGSLFVVGDTKQAIYGFRDADYQIMKRLESAETKTKPFDSADVQVRELMTNFRCRKRILDFVKDRFLLDAQTSERQIESDAEDNSQGRNSGGKAKYADYLKESGLGDFKQEPDVNFGDEGHVEYVVLDREGEVPDGQENSPDAEDGSPALPEDEAGIPEKREIQKRIKDLRGRGYSYADIAVLAYRNETVRQVSSWLNEIDVPIIPYSSLDIRRRKVIGEILALLQFLDSPPDDLSFAKFLLGEVLGKKVGQDPDADSLFPGGRRPDWHRFLFDCRLGKVTPLYGAFRRAYPALWDRYFERLFKIVGYYPLYDLVSLAYRVFSVFELFSDEEASLTRLLEAIKDFEGQGRNDLREFLTLSAKDDGDSSVWTIDVPSDIEAVKLMSIHKAKGLTFPAVILLLYPDRPPGAEFYLDQGEDSVRVLKLTQGIVADDPELQAVYDEAHTRDYVGRLNALYVAMTRAARELQVIGVKGKRTSYPFDFLGTRPFPSPPDPVKRPPAPDKTPRPASPAAGIFRFRQPFELPLNLRQSLNRDSIRRGEIAHALLAEVEYVRGGWENELAAAEARLDPEEREVPIFKDVRRTLALFFPRSGLETYFQPVPGRAVFRELEVCDRQGRLRRMDRVVIDPGEVIVIEYKTGLPSEPGCRKPWEEEDRRIFKSYLEIMADIHSGKAVRGLFVWPDRGAVEAVP